MSAFYILAPAAIDDLADIQSYVEEHRGDEAAVQVIDDLFEAFAKLGRYPGFGHRRRDLTASDVFFWTALRDYAVVYR